MRGTDGARARPGRSAAADSYFLAVLLVSLLLVAATLFRYQIWELPGALSLLSQLNLTAENNLAAWWSGTLLLLAALHARDGASARRLREPGAARGWFALAIVLAALSADEIGSLHERADALLGWGSWGSQAPFAIVLLGLLGFSLAAIVRGRDATGDAIRIGLGFACFAASAGQEFLEHRLVWTGWLSSVRGAVEEGTELAGMMILLSVTMRNTGGRFGRAGEIGAPVFSALVRHRRAILAAALGLAPFLAWATAGLSDPHRGRPADWAAGSLLLMASLAALRPFAFGGRIDRAALLLLAMPSLAASLLVVSIRIDLLVLEGLPGGPHSLRAVALCAISVLITAGWLATRGIRGAAGVASTLGLWVLVLLALGTRDRILSYGAYQGIGALVLARNTRGESP